MFWNNKELKILSFSGGAEKGEFSIRIAKALNVRVKKIDPKKDLVEHFDVITGNSIGSIITACLVMPSDKNPNKPKYSINDCIEIFDKDLHNINSNIGLGDKISLILNIKNHILTRKDVDFISEMCGDVKLSQTVVPVVITSTDAKTGEPHIWSTYEAKNDPKKDFYLKDAVGASISYPGLFDSKKTEKDGEIYKDFDGSLVADSPLLMALPHIFEINKKVSKEDVYIISIGTTTGNVQKVLGNIDKDSFVHNIYNIYKITGQIQKQPLDKLIKTFVPHFYKLDFMIPLDIQHAIYDKASKGDLLNFNETMACTKKYIAINEKFFIALANKIADKKQNMKELEKLYDDSHFYCDNPKEVLDEYNGVSDEKTDL